MRRAFIAFSVITLCAGLIAAEQAGELVLVGGKRIAVSKAELRDGMVWLTTDTGVMQAYPADEVDLAASGLLPGPPAEPEVEAEKAPDTALNVPASLRHAQAKSSGVSSMRITDADVEHVDPAALLGPEGEGEGGSAGPAGNDAFPLTDLEHRKRGERVQVSGTVTNNSGGQVEGLSVRIAAKDADGVTIGQGTTELRRILAPGASSPFTVMILGVSGEIAALSGTARTAETGQRSRPPASVAPPPGSLPPPPGANEVPE